MALPQQPYIRHQPHFRVPGSDGCSRATRRIKREQLNATLLTDCENEIIAAAEDQCRRSKESAYGTSFPAETKATRTAGWYFSGDAAFELATACQLDFPQMNDPRPKYVDAILGNLNYEAG